ncbi:MAG: bifunctional folylpolyglutamate synthase/dihydrofolate synthase [Microcoleaceae cyanobacterium]
MESTESLNFKTLLEQYQRFGVHLGLERIQQLLKSLGNPHQSVPIIHVAGTNGKGSVCAYLSSVLTQAGYRVGRYTSPHLVDWTERICINQQPISAPALWQVLQKIEAAAAEQDPSPTQFEVMTAAAWLYFAQEKVDLAVIEVGLGGRLDATNVCAHPLACVITSLSREHWQRLGPTLADIAREKAGILKPHRPAIVGQLPPEAKAVVQARILELNCPATWIQPAIRQPQQSNLPNRARYNGIDYALPLLGDVQLINSALAIATLQVLQQQGWQISKIAITQGIAQTHWPGRIQWTQWQGHSLLIDGAHNPAAAQELGQYVDQLRTSSQVGALDSPWPKADPRPVTWIMGMLSTKDHADIFQALLRQGDSLYLVPVPDHSSAIPEELAQLAQEICSGLAECQSRPDLMEAMETVFSDDQTPSCSVDLRSDSTGQGFSQPLTILCGSLYLIGYFLRIQNNLS